MTSATFRYVSGGSTRSVDIVKLPLSYSVSDDEYTDINWVRRKVIQAKYSKWKISFGLLSEADMEWLAELPGYATPGILFAGDGSYTEILVDEIDLKHEGGTITISTRSAV